MYCILRFKKHKGGSSRSLEAHHERQKNCYASNRDIDTHRTHQNFHIIKPQKWYCREIKSRIVNAGCRVRKDSIRFVDTLITASPVFFEGKTQEQTQEYFYHAVSFMEKKIGKSNIISAVVHLDERTPHMHMCFVPLTADNRLSAKEVLGNAARLSLWQDEFHSHMSIKWPEFERGQSVRDTQRKHIPIQLFKNAKKLDTEIEKIRGALENISVFNAGKKRDAAMDILLRWLPEAQSFTAQITSVDSHIKRLEQASRVKDSKLQSLEDRDIDKNMELITSKNKLNKLINQIREQEKLLSRLSPEVLEELKNGNQGKERSQ